MTLGVLLEEVHGVQEHRAARVLREALVRLAPVPVLEDVVPVDDPSRRQPEYLLSAGELLPLPCVGQHVDAVRGRDAKDALPLLRDHVVDRAARIPWIDEAELASVDDDDLPGEASGLADPPHQL